MIRLLLALLFASAASAQTPDSVVVHPRDARPQSGVRADLVLGGIAAGTTAVVLGRAALAALGASDARDWAFVLYPVGVVAGVHGLAHQQGFEGSVGSAARRTAGGTLIGLAGGYGLAFLAFEVSGGLFSNRNETATAALLLAGIGTVMIVPAAMAARAYQMPDATPVVLVGPDGERAAGVALRVGF